MSPSTAQENQRVPLRAPILLFHSSHQRKSNPMPPPSAMIHGKSNCSPVDRNILEMFLAVITVRSPHSWLLLSIELQSASVLAPCHASVLFAPFSLFDFAHSFDFVVLPVKAPDCQPRLRLAFLLVRLPRFSFLSSAAPP